MKLTSRLDNLFPQQQLAIQFLSDFISSKDSFAVLNGYAGTGKTYCSLAICKQFKLKPIIICPKSDIENWKNVCEYFAIEPENVINYEKVINTSFSTKNPA